MGPGTTFLPILSDPLFNNKESWPGVIRVCFVSGKLYYDLVKQRDAKGLQSKVALVRIEELNPFPAEQLEKELAKFSNAKDYYWVQEEPQNQGAYSYMKPRFDDILPTPLQYHGRAPLAAPATGISSVYKTEQKNVIDGVFGSM